MINTHGKLLISAFIIIILGVVLIGPLADEVELVKTATFTNTNESVTLSSGVGALDFDELVSVDACRNSSMSAVVVNIDCNITLASGVVAASQSNFTDNILLVDYTYTPDTYVRSGTARTLITLVILFFAIAILLIGIKYATDAFKQGGIM